MQRYSRKRQAILDCLRGTKTHPTAEWVYGQLKEAFPDLSRGTVYRNLAQLKEAGLVRSVGTVQGQERFDADLSPHTHTICTRCGAVCDLPDIPIPRRRIDDVQKETGFAVSRTMLQFVGLCASCRAKETT